MKKVVISLYVAACLVFSVHVLLGQDEATTKNVADPAPAVVAVPAAAPAPAAPAPEAPPAPAPAPAPTPEPAAPAVAPVPVSAASDLVNITTARDLPIQDALRLLQEQRKGVNFIMGPDVQGTVTLAIRDLPWETALQTITELAGCQAVKESENVYRIRKVAPATGPQITLELLKKEEAASLPQDAVARYLQGQTGLEGKSAAERKDWLVQNSGQFVKHLQVDNRPGAEVVSALAQAAGLNFVFNAGIKEYIATGAPAASAAASGAPAAPAPALPPVTLNLREVAVVDAMRLAATQGGLSCNDQNGIWVVSPKPQILQQQEPLVTETFTVNFLPVDDSLVAVIKGLLSKEGQVRAGKNKILIVRDTAENVESVRQIIESMDVTTPQVLIEARFFELSDDARKDLGIDWNDLGANGVALKATNLVPYNNAWEHVKANTDGAVTRTTTTTKVRSAVLSVADFSVVLRALQNDAGVRQLSNPKILVSSDEQATIHIGPQIPIVKSSITPGTGTGSNGGSIITYELDDAFGGETVQEQQLVEKPKTVGGATQQSGYTIRKGYLDLGTKLSVAPSVKTADEVYIKVVPELTSVTGEVVLKSGDLLISYPELYSTRVRTEFTIKSGQTIAIGGLVNEKSNKTVRKIPLLGSIPIAGYLFRYDSTEKTQSETIIFLTVKVVPSGNLLTESGIPAAGKLVEKELDQIKKDDQRMDIRPETTPEKPAEGAPAPVTTQTPENL